MNNHLKASTMAMLLLMAIFVVGCQKPDEPEQGGGGGSADTIVTYEFVDLGLPSGTLWAACNVGASSPEEFGDYFAWGETQPKETYSWDNYRYGDFIDETFVLTKYGPFDSLAVLLPDDDAARANWGEDWRMPTREEWNELYRKTTCVWTTRNGVDGRLLTGQNGNSIFLPATGFRLGDEQVGSTLGIYWSSTVHADYPERGWSFHFQMDDCHVCGTYERNRGQAVRAVRCTR